MRPLVLALALLAGCSQGTPECRDTPDCPGTMVCVLAEQRCIDATGGGDLMSAVPDFASSDLVRLDLSGAADLRTLDLASACGPSCETPYTCCVPTDVRYPPKCTLLKGQDTAHCGACNNGCRLPTGSCCEGRCVDFKSDNKACGGCGPLNVCKAPKTACKMGVCSLP